MLFDFCQLKNETPFEDAVFGGVNAELWSVYLDVFVRIAVQIATKVSHDVY